MKQVIIVRADLKLPKGKLASQACHASVEAVLCADKDVVEKWMKQGMKKVVLKVRDKRSLMYYYKKAKKMKLNVSLIRDAAKTFLKKPDVTCIAIGPDKEEEIDRVSGKLKML